MIILRTSTRLGLNLDRSGKIADGPNDYVPYLLRTNFFSFLPSYYLK